MPTHSSKVPVRLIKSRRAAVLPFVVVVACSRAPQAEVRASEPPRAQAATAPPATAAVKPAAEGQDFAHEVRLLYRLAACAGSEPIPTGLEAVVEAHCKALLPLMELHLKKYVEPAQPFLAALEPKGLPSQVVYPFGGGDLLTALTTYKDLTEVTTLSLELSGDPRRIDNIDAKRLEDSLLKLRKGVSGLLALSDSTSENLMQLQRGEIPGQLAFFLIGLAVHKQEPVGLRYFRIEPDASLHYMTEAEIAAAEGQTATKLNAVWKAPDFSVAFSNSELSFRPVGAPDNAPVRVHRHIAFNLSDGPLTKDPRVIKHLEGKGKVVAMTKAASFILWSSGFNKIRNYLLSNMEFMVSDATGIPPRYAKKAGFIQETYGLFTGPFLETSVKDAEDFCELWNSQPRRGLPFRYGYPDVDRHFHLLITKRAPEKTGP
jgi:hypothetical protein